MAKSINQVTILGNLGRDAEVRKIGASGAAVVEFSVATTRSWKDKQSNDWKEETEWHRVVCWRAENLAQYLTKGIQVCVVGRLQTRSWEKDGQKHYATEIVADTIVPCGPKTDKALDPPSVTAPPLDDLPF